MAKSKQKKVAAPLIQLRVTTGGYVHLYAGAPVPETADPAQLKQLLKEKQVVEVEVDDPADGSDSAKEATVDEVLADVGTDKDKAKAAIEAEKAGKNRSTLLTKLQAVVDAS